MSILNSRYLYDNSKIIKYKTSRIDTLGIRLYFPTDVYKVSVIMNTLTLEVNVKISGVNLIILKTVGYELPGCVLKFADLSKSVIKMLLDTITDNIVTNGSDVSVSIVDGPIDYVTTLNNITGSNIIDGMSLDTIRKNKPMDLSAVMAMDQEGGVGYNEHLPWRLPDELSNFRRLTTGKLLICGSSTYSNMGSLSNRILLVMSSSGELPPAKESTQEGLAIPIQSHAELMGVLATTRVRGDNEVSVIGGPIVLSLFKEQFDIVNLTTVDDSKLRNVPNVFIDTSIEFFITPPYVDCGITATGDGWSTRRYERC